MSAPYHVEWCILLHHSNPALLQMPTAGRRDVTRPENPFSAPNRLDLQARAIRVVVVVTQPKARTKTLKTCGASVDEESHLRTVRPAAAAAFFSGPKPTSQPASNQQANQNFPYRARHYALPRPAGGRPSSLSVCCVYCIQSVVFAVVSQYNRIGGHSVCSSSPTELRLHLRQTSWRRRTRLPMKALFCSPRC